MQNRSIRWRITRGLAAYTLVLMIGMCAVYFFSTRYAQRHAVTQVLQQNERQLKDQIAGHPYLQIHDLIASNDGDWVNEGTAVIVVNSTGKIIDHSSGQVFPWPLRNDSWRVKAFNYKGNKIVIGVPWDKTEERLRRRTLLLFLLSIFVVVALAAGAWVAVGRTLSPLDGLTEAVQEASATNGHLRLQPPSQDAEMVRLVETLNDLLSRQEETMAARGRFYAAAAHELRTPLQALTGHLELALGRPRSVGEYKEALQEGHTQAEQLTDLVQGLLLLNQLETGTAKAQKDQLDLADICQTELASLELLTDERGLTIESTFADNCEITAPWNHSKILIRNILENAIKYASPNSTVTIQLDKSTFIVHNECDFQNADDMQKYFEPFYRPDESRTSEVGGNGLGLAICKGICEVNGWEISLVRKADGMMVEVRF
ncbi:MAG: ATP-binding protein [Abditibacteriaceae bacterium]